MQSACCLMLESCYLCGLHGQFHHACWQLLSQVEIFRYAIINRMRLLNIYYLSLMVLYNWLTRGHVYTDGSNRLADRLYQPHQGCLPRSTITWGCIIQTTISENLYGVRACPATDCFQIVCQIIYTLTILGCHTINASWRQQCQATDAKIQELCSSYLCQCHLYSCYPGCYSTCQ